MIDWSNELSGVKLGAEDLLDNVKEDTMIVDISGAVSYTHLTLPTKRIV